MRWLPAILLLSLIPASVYPERLQSRTGEEFTRGSILSVHLAGNGQPVVLIRNWDGSCGLITIDQNGGTTKTVSFGNRNLFVIRPQGEQYFLGEAPLKLETWMFRKIDPDKGTILLEIEVPEICQLAREKGYSPETVEGYYHITPDGRFMMAEFRLPDFKKVRRRTEYYNRQIMIIDLFDGKTMFSRFFLTEQGFLGSASPRYFPLYNFVSDREGTRFILAGPVNKPALYREKLIEPANLFPLSGEARFHFLDNNLLFQWDHYGRRCRFFDLTDGRLLTEFEYGIRFPVFHDGGHYLVSLQDDGYHLYIFDGSTITHKGFYQFTRHLIGCRYGFFRDNTLILFPSRFDGNEIQWEKIDLSEVVLL